MVAVRLVPSPTFSMKELGLVDFAQYLELAVSGGEE